MQSQTNCQRHLWILSGTGEGPHIAAAFVKRGWKVTLSVVSDQAAVPYREIPLQELLIGALEGSDSIERVLQKARQDHNGFKCVIDATHPFAKEISSNLKNACIKQNQKIIRFERPFERLTKANLIKSSRAMASLNLSGKRLLIALGSRHLPEAVFESRKSGAKVFARILPNPTSLRKALMSSLPESHLALVKPTDKGGLGELEAALCRKWSITDVLCKQSGGLVEKIWHEVCEKENIQQWLITRPPLLEGIEIVNTLSELIDRLQCFNQNEPYLSY